jgi:hypothetical protein
VQNVRTRTLIPDMMVKKPMHPDSMQAERRPKRTSTPKVAAPQREVCPKCGSPNARIIGRSESFPILYFRCDDCRRTSVGPAV